MQTRRRISSPILPPALALALSGALALALSWAQALPASAVEGGYPASGEPVGTGSHRAMPAAGHGPGKGEHRVEPAAKHPAAKKKARKTRGGQHTTGKEAGGHASAPGHLPPASGPTPTDALKKLLEGNRRYVERVFFHPEALPDRRSEVARGQHPFAIVLGCADSRVPPELVFDQGLGDLFVIRVAGNVPSPHVLGSIEYAVEHLGTPLIVVLGHERCGAVQAAAGGGEAPGNIGSLVTAIKPAVDEIRIQRPTSPDGLVDLCVRNNVMHVVRDIVQQSAIVTHFVQAGRVRVQGARYDLDTGMVELIP